MCSAWSKLADAEICLIFQAFQAQLPIQTGAIPPHMVVASFQNLTGTKRQFEGAYKWHCRLVGLHASVGHIGVNLNDRARLLVHGERGRVMVVASLAYQPSQLAGPKSLHMELLKRRRERYVLFIMSIDGLHQAYGSGS